MSSNEAEHLCQLFPSINKIGDMSLRAKVVETLLRTWKESSWERIELVPFNPRVQGCTLVQHTNSVVDISLAIAHILQDNLQVLLNFDILLAGALLHDASKMLEFEKKEDGTFGKSTIGLKIPHASYGAHIALDVGLPLEVLHLIFTHTPQTAMLPNTTEGLIMTYADYVAADVLFLRDGGPLLIESRYPPNK